MGVSSLRVYILLTLLLVSLGCHLRSFDYTDPKHKVTVTYAPDMTLLNDPEILAETGTDSEVELLFALQTKKMSTFSCAIHQVPGDFELTADSYYEATTARELKFLGAKIVEPKSEIQLDGRTFQWVGYELVNEEQSVRSRIYQHYDPKSRRVLVLSPVAPIPNWDEEIKLLEPVVHSVKLDW